MKKVFSLIVLAVFLVSLSYGVFAQGSDDTNKKTDGLATNLENCIKNPECKVDWKAGSVTPDVIKKLDSEALKKLKADELSDASILEKFSEADSLNKLDPKETEKAFKSITGIPFDITGGGIKGIKFKRGEPATLSKGDKSNVPLSNNVESVEIDKDGNIKLNLKKENKEYKAKVNGQEIIVSGKAEINSKTDEKGNTQIKAEGDVTIGGQKIPLKEGTVVFDEGGKIKEIYDVKKGEKVPAEFNGHAHIKISDRTIIIKGKNSKALIEADVDTLKIVGSKNVNIGSMEHFTFYGTLFIGEKETDVTISPKKVDILGGEAEYHDLTNTDGIQSQTNKVIKGKFKLELGENNDVIDVHLEGKNSYVSQKDAQSRERKVRVTTGGKDTQVKFLNDKGYYKLMKSDPNSFKENLVIWNSETTGMWGWTHDGKIEMYNEFERPGKGNKLSLREGASGGFNPDGKTIVTPFKDIKDLKMPIADVDTSSGKRVNVYLNNKGGFEIKSRYNFDPEKGDDLDLIASKEYDVKGVSDKKVELIVRDKKYAVLNDDNKIIGGNVLDLSEIPAKIKDDLTIEHPTPEQEKLLPKKGIKEGEKEIKEEEKSAKKLYVTTDVLRRGSKDEELPDIPLDVKKELNKLREDIRKGKELNEEDKKMLDEVKSEYCRGKVCDLQVDMFKQSYAVKIDGKYGKETVSSVRKFQDRWNNDYREEGLEMNRDGIAGPLTLAALRGTKEDVINTGITYGALNPPGLNDLNKVRSSYNGKTIEDIYSFKSSRYEIDRIKITRGNTVYNVRWDDTQKKYLTDDGKSFTVKTGDLVEPEFSSPNDGRSREVQSLTNAESKPQEKKEPTEPGKEPTEKKEEPKTQPEPQKLPQSPSKTTTLDVDGQQIKVTQVIPLPGESVPNKDAPNEASARIGAQKAANILADINALNALQSGGYPLKKDNNNQFITPTNLKFTQPELKNGKWVVKVDCKTTTDVIAKAILCQ